MTNKKSTKRALLMSVLSLLLCCAMLTGTTFAWFTDSVTSGRNTIQSGNLDVVLEYKTDWDNDWATVDENTKLFDDAALYEPGYTEVVFLRVSNAGSLALKYNLGVDIYGETSSTNVAGESFVLSDYLEIGTYVQDEYSSGANYADILMPIMFGSREAALSSIGDNFFKVSEATGIIATDAPINPGDKTAQVVALVLTMPETVGNEANHKTGVAAPTIDLGVTLLATQLVHEKDSFGPDYDEDATYPEFAAKWDGTVDTSWYNDTDTEFVIDTAEELAGFAQLVNEGNNFDGKTIELGKDIDLNNLNWTPIGGIDASYDFKGEFDGNGYTISSILMNIGDQGANKIRAGLFASPTEAYIHDLSIVGVDIVGSGSDIRAGALAGNVWTGTIIENVIVDDVQMNINGGSYLGGVAGRVYFAQMNNVDAANIEITNNNADGVYIGGYTSHAAGHTSSGGAYNWVDAEGNRVINSLFDDCDIDGVVINAKTEAKAAYIGGFVSSNQYNNSENFYENCNITGLDINCEGYSFVVGGFIGESYGQSTTAPNGKQYSFDGCSVQGTIDGTNGTYGGFIGIFLGRAKAYAGASADVDIVCTGTAGGFVGKTAHTHQNNTTNTQKVSFTNCVATGDVTAAIAGGFVGNITIGSDASRRIEFTATNCSASGIVNGTDLKGGFAGTIDGSRVSVADSYVVFESCTGSAGMDLYGKLDNNESNPTIITVK